MLRMLLIKTIFRHELKLLIKQRWLLLAMLSFILISFGSVLSGNHTVNQQIKNIESINTAYQRDYQAQLAKFADTLTREGKSAATYQGLPAMINYRVRQQSVKPPQSLAALSLGVTDIQPWHKTIEAFDDHTDRSDAPVNNPIVLFIGNCDLSFVLVYLLPLLVLVFWYNIYASEREQGTLSLLKVQAGAIEGIFRTKVLFRFLLLTALLCFVNTIGFIVAAKQQAIPFSQITWWMIFSILYLLFWVSLASVVVSLKKSAIVSGLYLLAAWVLLLILLPSVLNTAVQTKYPLPMKDEIASYRRHQSEEIWRMNPKKLVDSFNTYYPKYAAGVDLKKDTVHLSERFVAGYYELLDRRMQRVLIPYHNQLRNRNAYLVNSNNILPPQRIQYIFNTLAGTNLSAYEDYFAQSGVFQREWKSFLYNFEMTGQYLTPKDFENFPIYEYKTIPLKNGLLLWSSLYLTAIILVLLLIGYLIFKKVKNGYL